MELSDYFFHHPASFKNTWNILY